MAMDTSLLEAERMSTIIASSLALGLEQVLDRGAASVLTGDAPGPLQTS